MGFGTDETLGATTAQGTVVFLQLRLGERARKSPGTAACAGALVPWCPLSKPLGFLKRGSVAWGGQDPEVPVPRRGSQADPPLDHLAALAPLLHPSALPRCCTQTATQRYPMSGAVLCFPVPDSISGQLPAPSQLLFVSIWHLVGLPPRLLRHTFSRSGPTNSGS